MKFIVLVGVGEKGKTTTLKEVIRKLIESGARSATASPNNFKGMKTTKDICAVLEKGDVSVELIYKCRKIGITTFGDDRRSIEEKIAIFIQDKCDCIICASHPSGTSNTYIQELEMNPDYQICKVQKIGCCGDKKDWKYINLCDFSDSLTANEIISKI